MKRKKTIITIIQMLCIIVFIAGGILLCYFLHQYKAADSFYEDVANKCEEKDPNVDPDRIPPDWDKLHKINPDVIGWIRFPSNSKLKQINYPIVKSNKKSDNTFWLHHLINRQYNFAGSLFVASWADVSFLDDDQFENTVIYGHAMNNKTMFGSIKYLFDQKVINKTDHFYLFVPGKNYEYKVFSVHETKDTSDCYLRYFEDENEMNEYVKKEKQHSVVKTEKIQSKLQITHAITLSTCNNFSYYGRRVVHAYRASEF